MLNPVESALLRGWAQGLPLQVLGLQYLDARSRAETRRTLEALRATLVARAQWHGKPAWATALGDSIQGWPARRGAVQAAIAEIERLAPPQLRLQDVPAQWLPAPLAKKLEKGAFANFEALFVAFERDGYDWWRAVPKFRSLDP